MVKPSRCISRATCAIFIERGRDQSAQSNKIDLRVASGLKNFFARHHHAEVDDFVIVAGEHDANNIFADVMDVALDGGHEDFALGAAVAAGPLFLFHEGQQPGDGFLHDPRALDHLRQKTSCRTKQIAHHASCPP